MTELARQIISLVDSGMSGREIADKTGASIATVYGYASRSGKRITGGLMKPVLYGKEEQIRKLIESGVTYSEIGRMYGIEKQTVRHFCKKNGFERTEEQKKADVNPPQNIEEVIQKVNTCGKGVEYVGGYVNNHSPIIVRRKACGHQYSKRYDVILFHSGDTCPICKAEREAEKREQRQKEEAKKTREREKREVERARAKARAEKEAERKRKAKIHPCPVCGETTEKPKYCSDRCRKRAGNSRREFIRRMKIKNAMDDPDITLESLYKRDSGRCHICGLQCNYEDYVVKDGAFIVGDWYPTIDHVMPLSKGGRHAWSNVKLAHFRCNSYKRDKVYPPGV